MLSHKKYSRWFVLRLIIRNRKLVVTVALLALYRFLTFIPVPGIDPVLLEQVTSGQDSPNLVTGLLNLLSGGGYSRLSVLALGVYPILAAGGFLKFLVPILPGWERKLQEDPREGTRTLEMWKYILIAPASVLQAFTLFYAFGSNCTLGLFPRISFQADPLSALTILATLTAGAYLVAWMAEWINRDGIRGGQGLNAIIFSGAAMLLFEEMYRAWQGPQPGALPVVWGGLSSQAGHWLGLGVYGLALLAGLVIMVYFLESRRNVPVHFPGRRLAWTPSKSPRMSSLPITMSLTWNGIVDAQAVLTLPLMVATFLVCSPRGEWQQAGASLIAALQPDSLWSGPLLFLSIVLFGPILATLKFGEEHYAEKMKRMEAYVAGMKPGTDTQRHLNFIFLRISFVAALLAGIIFLIPWIVNLAFELDTLLLTGEALYLLVAFTQDLIVSVQADLVLQGYEIGRM